MKQNHFLLGAVVLLLGGYAFYYKKVTKSTVVTTGALSGNLKGYSNLMNLSPKYYNTTSTEGTGSQKAEDFSDAAMAANPWTLGHNGGDAMEISAGWTDFPDSYSAVVSHSWIQQAVDGSHL